jgi:hypothetical protein
MWRLLAVAALALAAAATPAGATHSDGNGPKNQDFVTGTGKLPDFPSLGGQFHFDAHSGPIGENPGGHYFAHEGLGGLASFHAVVECLRVFVQPPATVAIVRTRATRTREGPPEGSTQIFRVEDRGEPGAEGDMFTGRPTIVPEEDCHASEVVFPTPQPLESGNFTIHDAPVPGL